MGCPGIPKVNLRIHGAREEGETPSIDDLAGAAGQGWSNIGNGAVFDEYVASDNAFG